jgi:hypothetical protein
MTVTYSTTARIETSLNGEDVRIDDIGIAREVIQMSNIANLLTGTGDNEINLILRRSFTTTGGGAIDTVRIDAFQSEFASSNAGFGTIKAIVIRNKATAGSDIVKAGVLVAEGGGDGDFELCTPFNSTAGDENFSYLVVRGSGFTVMTSPLSGWVLSNETIFNFKSDARIDVDVVLFGIAA